MKYKVGTSKIQGKGLIVKKPIKKGERIGTAHINGKPTSVVGKYHNHEDEPTALNVKEGNKRYLIADRDLMPGDEITTNYRLQPELEQPEDFKKGGAVRLPKMPKPSKKGVLAKGYSRSLDATNRLFTEHVLFEKPKSKKNKVFDPNANFQDGGAPIPKGYQAALSQFIEPEVIETPYNTAYNSYTGTIGQDSNDPNQTQDWWMEHEKLHHLQNSAGALHSAGSAGLRANPYVDSQQALDSNDRRKTELDSQIDQMIKADPNLQFIPREKLAQSTYDEDMQEPGFVGAEDLMYADPSTVEGEARAYEQYIRQGGKSVFPKQQKGGFIETELTDDEIQGYRDGGYIVEEIDEPQYQDGGVYTHPGRPGAKYLKRDDGWYVQSPGKSGYVKVQDPQGNRTKELNKAAVLTDEVYAFNPSQQKYLNDSVPLNKAVSESTDTQASRNLTKNIESKKIDETNKGITQKANMRTAYVQSIKNDPNIKAENKDKLISDYLDKSQTEQNETAYLNLTHDDKVKPLTAPLGASAWDIATNPFDAFKYSVVTGDVNNMPRNYNDAKFAGVDMSPRSYNERFNYGTDTGGGTNMVGAVLNQFTNPLDMGDKVYKYARKGDYLNAGLNLARFAPALGTGPGIKVTNYLGDVGDAVGTVMSKTPLARFTNSSSSPLIQAIGKSASVDNVLSAKGISSGILNSGNLIDSGLNYYSTGSNKDLNKFAGEAIKSAASLAPLTGAKTLAKINPYRTSYFGTKAGFDLMHKPEDDHTMNIPSLLKTFNVKQEGGTVDAELTDAEIEDLLAQGYIIEELD